MGRVNKEQRVAIYSHRTFLGVIKLFWNEREVMVARHCEYTKCHSTARVKIVVMFYVSFSSSQKERRKTEIREKGAEGGGRGPSP